MHAAVLATDHPAWESPAAGNPSRLVRKESAIWRATWTGDRVELTCLQGPGARPAIRTVTADSLPPRTPPCLAAALAELGTVHRLPNPWLWDAITTAILRQVVRAAQARALYRTWCQTHGMSIADDAGKLALPPGPQTVLALPGAAFSEAGTAFHRTTLQAAAAAYLQHADAWSELPPAELADALDTVPGIGPWTARAAAADYTGDFSIYPHGDLAVRTWASRTDPEHPWPTKEKPFAAAWQNLADHPDQLSALTLLTLTRGSHAHSDERHHD